MFNEVGCLIRAENRKRKSHEPFYSIEGYEACPSWQALPKPGER